MEEADQLDRRRRQDVRRGARAIKQEKHRERQSERERERGGGLQRAAEVETEREMTKTESAVTEGGIMNYPSKW